MSGGSRSSQKSESQPWAGQQPYLSDLYRRAEQAYQQGPLEFYPGSTVAERSPYSADALQRLGTRGVSPSVSGAQDYTADVLQGEYLGANPYLDAMYERASGRLGEEYNRIVRPQIGTATGRAGRGGGVVNAYERMAQDQLTDELADLATQIYGGDYARERGFMEGAAGRAGQTAAAERAELASGLSAGLESESYEQRLLDDLVARFNFAQDEPYLRTERFGQLLGEPITTSRSSGSSWSFNLL